jgi:hypothetical protein
MLRAELRDVLLPAVAVAASAVRPARAATWSAGDGKA